MSDEGEPPECECGEVTMLWDARLGRWYCPDCEGEGEE